MATRLRLFTVHGVGRSDDWQAAVEEVLGHYFDCVRITYPQFYDRNSARAVLKVVVDPWCFLAFSFSGALFFFHVLWKHDTSRHIRAPFYDSYAALFSLAILFLVSGLLLAGKRRKQAESAVRQQIEDNATGGVAAHLIAHSLGTYLACRTLRAVQGLKLKRVIYVGSVVKRRFSWDELSGRRIEAVRNEVGGQDLVVILAGVAKFLFGLTDLGWAGWKGFQGSVAHVHSSQDPELPCAACTILKVPVPVHNTHCPYDSHNSLFLSGFHAARFWLPFLWEYDPGYFRAFLDRCQSWAHMGPADAEEEFSRLRYASWGGSFVFEEMVVREMRANPNLKLSPGDSPDPRAVKEVLVHTLKLIGEAQQAMEKIKRPRNALLNSPFQPIASEGIIAALQYYDPRAAVWRAIDTVFPKVGSVDTALDSSAPTAISSATTGVPPTATQ